MENANLFSLGSLWDFLAGNMSMGSFCKHPCSPDASLLVKNSNIWS